MPSLLHVTGLTLSARDKILADHVTFDIQKGQILGIVGESGSGKSLTALSMTRLLPESIRIIEGKVLYTGDDKVTDLLTVDDDEIRKYRGRKIAMIFQEPMTSLNPSMTCGRQVAECINAHFTLPAGEVRSRVIDLFNEVLLPDPQSVYRKYPHQLSGGQRQRVMIAMALSADPELLIADEPTTALDVTVQKTIIDLLKNLRKKHDLSLMFISHDLRLIKGFADEVMVMREGKVMEKGPVHKIFHDPATPYTKGLMACQPPLDYKPARLLTVKDFESGKTFVKEEIKPAPAADPDKEPLLRVNNLTVSYPLPGGSLLTGKKHFNAVNNISFDIYRGETLGLVGESGCGKTTAGKAILKLINSGGDITFRGKKISSLKGNDLRQFRKSVQVVFQDPFSSLNPGMTVFAMIDESLKVHHPSLNRQQRRERTAELLDNVGLAGSDMIKYPHQFSGGQRQRISIARSLSPEPELLILDESVSALDVSVQAQVLNLLNDLKEKFNLTYLFISHDLSVIKYMSDRIIVMNMGKIEESGDAEDVFSSPVSEYTKKLISAVPK